jgi:hypothetical protein
MPRKGLLHPNEDETMNKGRDNQQKQEKNKKS